MLRLFGPPVDFIYTSPHSEYKVQITKQ